MPTSTSFLSTSDIELNANTSENWEQKQNNKKKELKNNSQIVYSFENEIKESKENEWCANPDYTTGNNGENNEAIGKQSTSNENFAENSLAKENLDSVKSGESVFKVNTHVLYTVVIIERQ